MSRIDFKEVERRASGNWDTILSALGPFKNAVDRTHRVHVECPMHKDDKRDAFRLFNDFIDTGGGICSNCGSFPTGFKLLAAAKNLDIREVFAEVAEHLGMTRTGNTPAPAAQQRTDSMSQQKRAERAARRDLKVAELLKDAHARSLPLSHPDAEPARLYLSSRGLDWHRAGSQLAFHPGMDYIDYSSDKPISLGNYPVLLSAVRAPDGNVVTYHRIFITADGKKAPVPDPKRLMPLRSNCHASGGAIRLASAKDVSVLGVTEGIETALAVILGSGMPTWSCVSAPMLASVVIPPHVRTVVIWADLDRSHAGQEASQTLADRLAAEGRQVFIHFPPGPIKANTKSCDWLDAWVEYGPGAFPSRRLHMPKEQQRATVIPFIQSA